MQNSFLLKHGSPIVWSLFVFHSIILAVVGLLLVNSHLVIGSILLSWIALTLLLISRLLNKFAKNVKAATGVVEQFSPVVEQIFQANPELESLTETLMKAMAGND